MMQLLSIIVQVGRVIPPRLVAVSKNQSVEKVQWAYQEGLRHFGENYVSAVDVLMFPTIWMLTLVLKL